MTHKALLALVALLGLALGQVQTPSDGYTPELLKVIQKIGVQDARNLITHKAHRIWILGPYELYPGFAESLAGKKIRFIVGSDDLGTLNGWMSRIPARDTEVEVCVVPGTTLWGLVLANPTPPQRPSEQTFFLGIDEGGNQYLYTHDERITGPIESFVFNQFLALASTYLELAQKGASGSPSYQEFYRRYRPQGPCLSIRR